MIQEDKIIEYENQYHLEQFVQPKRSTEKFCEFLDSKLDMSKSQCCVDLGAGMGAVTAYMALRWPTIEFTGLDNNKSLIVEGKTYVDKIVNLSLKEGDLFNISNVEIKKVEGIICLQTLNWLEDYKRALLEMSKCNPSWIAISVLLYDGPIDFEINVTEYFGDYLEIERPHLYKIFSKDKFLQELSKLSPSEILTEKFEIDIELPAPENKLMKTHTIKTIDEKLLQISGTILMPWYFVLIKL